MRSGPRYVLAIGISFLMASGALAQEVFIYPNEGQDQQQQEKDKFECYGWAKQSTGFDPMAPPTAQTAPPSRQEPKGGVVPGAVAGAAVGTAAGLITGRRTGKKAAVGAVAGGMVGGMRRNEQRRQEEADRKQWEQQEVANYQRNRNNYNRAYAACLEGRGYTVR